MDLLHNGGSNDEVNMTIPFSYVKHINFLNFEEFNLTNPIYVNMVSMYLPLISIPMKYSET